ncbi:MAG: hypothetical protein AB1445_00755 [Bacillota bacterium]
MKRTPYESASKSVSLLVSVLVRYPEVAAVDFDPTKQTIKFTFLLTRALSKQSFRELASKVVDSLEAFNALEGKGAGTVAVHRVRHPGLTVVEVTRDVASLTQAEISLVVAVVREHSGRVLAADGGEAMQEEELAVQEELIAEMLEDVRVSQQGRNLTAFREDGKVVVFNK